MFVPNTVHLLETVDKGGEGWTLGMQHNVVPQMEISKIVNRTTVTGNLKIVNKTTVTGFGKKNKLCLCPIQSLPLQTVEESTCFQKYNTQCGGNIPTQIAIKEKYHILLAYSKLFLTRCPGPDFQPEALQAS